MPIGLKVKADARGILTALNRLRSSFNDLRPALTNASKELTRRVWYRFAFKRDPDGQRWAPWSPRTKREAADSPKRKLMLDTRQLRDKTRFIPGRRDIRAVLGTSYGKYHEQPGAKATGGLPRRAFLFSRRNGGRALAKNDEKYLLNALRYQIRKAARK